MYPPPVLVQVGALQAEASQTKEEALLVLDLDPQSLVEQPKAKPTENNQRARKHLNQQSL